jgi:hypothetical protein
MCVDGGGTVNLEGSVDPWELYGSAKNISEKIGTEIPTSPLPKDGINEEESETAQNEKCAEVLISRANVAACVLTIKLPLLVYCYCVTFLFFL